MNRKITLQQDERILSTVTGLFESFDGIQNLYFGDLHLTNKRIWLVSNRLINVEESLWFEEEMRNIGHSSLIVGKHRIKVIWTYNGNLLNFMNAFQQLSVNA